jgi:ectoine hydroxylase-related dioxygenase (phytanoyl-CoA dioxygenase family)
LNDCLLKAIEEHGFALVASAIPADERRRLLRGVATRILPDSARGGVRLRSAAVPAVRAVATGSTMQAIAASVLGGAAFPVRAIYFDKTPRANWKVAWHQDLTIAVRARIDRDGFGPWSSKDGVTHVQPPVGVLERMVAIRLHLDDCTDSNGPLRVIPGSHTSGRLSASGIAAIRAREAEHVCTARAGDLLVFKPLLRHASSVATEPGHRRVMQIEYAYEPLPGGLEWFEQCA